jgi:DNA-binding transcriptional regulator PaaX
VTTLRASQIETLEAVARLERSTTAYIRTLAIAVEQKRGEHATEKSLSRLTELGHLDRSYDWVARQSTYRLTTKGRSELSGRESNG